MSDYIIGLTGGIGSGKTTVSNIFNELHIEIIDADIIARDVVAKGSNGLKAIKKHFGNDVIEPNGELNRALLRQKIFSNKADKDWLNGLLHPLIRDEIISQALSATSKYCIISAPLLIENKLTNLVNRVLVVDVTETTQLKRTTSRDNNTIEQVQAIIDSQITRKERLTHANDIISNENCSIAKLRETIIKLHREYLLYAEQKMFNK